MVRLQEKDITEVRNKADIAEIIGRYIPLVKKGKGLMAVCPFHDDHNPSLSISEDKQIYKCFVCGNGGNVFTFVQNYERISFVEAVLKVAEYCHVQLGYRAADLLDGQLDEKTKGYFKLLSEAIAFQQYQINALPFKSIKEYLYKRGYDDEIIKTFNIGYNPDDDALLRFMKAKGYAESDLLDVNLVRQYEGRLHDAFSDRITFPICDRNGNPIAFTARAARKGQQPKYINTSETVLYTKGDVLYNYHNAVAEARRARLIYVVEGVTDVIALCRAGVKNVVATLGTALSKEQLRLLRQLSGNVAFCYDGDEAGIQATLKGAKMALEANCTVTIVDNRSGQDPDEIILEKGLEGLNEMLSKHLSWIEFFMTQTLKKYDLNNYSQKKAYAMEVAKEITLLKDDFDQKNFLQRLSTMTEFDIKQLEGLIRKDRIVPSKPVRPVVQTTLSHVSGRMKAEYEILTQMLISREACAFFVDHIGFLTDDDNNRLAILILDHYRRSDKLEIADFLNFIDEDRLKKFVLDLSEWEFLPKSYNRDALKGAYRKIKIGLIDEKIADIRKNLRIASDSSVKTVLANEMLDLKKERIAILEDKSDKEKL